MQVYFKYLITYKYISSIQGYSLIDILRHDLIYFPLEKSDKLVLIFN